MHDRLLCLIRGYTWAYCFLYFRICKWNRLSQSIKDVLCQRRGRMCYYTLVPRSVGLRGTERGCGACYCCAPPFIARARPSAIWSMAPCNLPPIIIFIIMFSSTCSTRRMRVSYSETEWS